MFDRGSSVGDDWFSIVITEGAEVWTVEKDVWMVEEELVISEEVLVIYEEVLVISEEELVITGEEVVVVVRVVEEDVGLGFTTEKVSILIDPILALAGSYQGLET